MKKLIIILFLSLLPGLVNAQSKRFNDSLFVYFYDSKNKLDSVYISKKYESSGLRAIENFNNHKDNKVMGVIAKIFLTAALGTYFIAKK